MNQKDFEATLKDGQEVRLRWHETSVLATVERVNKSSIAVRIKEPIAGYDAGSRVVVARVLSGRRSAGKCVRPVT